MAFKKELHLLYERSVAQNTQKKTKGKIQKHFQKTEYFLKVQLHILILANKRNRQ